MKIYQFDGSLVGFYSAIFDYFLAKEHNVTLVHASFYTPQMFDQLVIVDSDEEKFQRVFTKLSQIIKKEVNQFFHALLSEDAVAIQYAFEIAIEILKGQSKLLNNYGDARVLYHSQMLKKVSRERHRMKAFIRFQKSADDLYFAIIEPDFNVLPLIIDFFKNRYADQQWMIYDVKRNYGIHYDLKTISEINLVKESNQQNGNTSVTIPMAEEEELYQTLWKRYFKSTNIEARKNMKLHLQHVPKRYWKYLTEKQ